MNLLFSFLNIRDGIYADDLVICGLTKLRLAQLLNKYPQGISFDKIRQKTKVKERPLKVLMSLLECMNFFRFKNNLYFLGKEFKKNILDTGLIHYLDELNQRKCVKDFEQVLKTDKPIPYPKRGDTWENSLNNRDFVKEFNNTMKVRGEFLAKHLFKKLNLSNNKIFLDIGGSSGAYSKQATSIFQNLKAIVLDKDVVLKETTKGDRMTFYHADMFSDNFPEADIHFYSNVLHDWGIDTNLELLKKSFLALPKKGKIVIHDAFYSQKLKEDLPVIRYSALLMLLTQGRCYSVEEMKSLLEQAGFKKISFKKTAAGRGVIVGIKP